MKKLLALFCCIYPGIGVWAEADTAHRAEIVEAQPYVTGAWRINYALLADDKGELPVATEQQDEESANPVRVEIPRNKPRIQSSNPPQTPSSSSERFDFEEYAKAQFATFRSSGNVYFKGRAGYLWVTEDEHPDNLSIGQMVNGLDSHGAFGVGAGYRLSNGERLEFDYTVNKRDEKVFSIGYKF